MDYLIQIGEEMPAFRSLLEIFMVREPITLIKLKKP